MKVCVICLAVGLCALTIPAHAKTYTPQQLARMILKKKYPKVGRPTTETKSADFESCQSGVQSIRTSVGGHYPASTIVSTSSLYMFKVWTNNAEMLFTCSRPDEKMTIVISPYI